jgi:hypothetical protein
VATELQKAYVATARTYYETGFRRYMRSLGWIKGRTTEKDPGLVSGLDVPERQADAFLERLSYARIDGPGATLAYMADDKSYVAILRAKFANFGCSDLPPSRLTERGRGSSPSVRTAGLDGQWNLGICLCHHLLRT